MTDIRLLNPVSPVWREVLSPEEYHLSEDAPSPRAIIVRSADMHGMALPETVLAVGRAGVGVNNIPLDELAEMGVPVFNTPGANANAVKELVIAALLLAFHHKGFEAVFHTQYVSKQYFTNYENPNMMLDAYCVTNLNLAYTFRTRTARSVRLGLMVNNLFNTEYESNGYGWSEAYEGTQTDHAFYFPQAPLNVLANVTVKF